MEYQQSARTIIPLLTIVFLLIGYNFMSAQWTGPTATAPGANTDAPINTGSDPQDKNGVLGVNALAVFGSSTFAGQPNIQNAGPRIKYTDTDNNDFWTHANSDSFYVIADRNDDGTWTGDSPHPMQLYAGATSNDDYVRFSNQARANSYCDVLGNNCFSATEVTETPGSMEFGGMYIFSPNSRCGQVGYSCSLVCSTANPSTGSCSCPAGFTANTIRFSAVTCRTSGDSDPLCSGSQAASTMSICVK